jgi:hypothetical protein
VNQDKKDIESSRARLREEVKNIQFTKPVILGTVSPQKNILPWKSITGLLVFCIVVAIISIFLYHEPDVQENSPSISTVAPWKTTAVPFPSQSDQSLLSSIQAPEQTIQSGNMELPAPVGRYPSGWPDELCYSTPFVMEDANTIRLPYTYLPAYSVKMHYQGEAKDAAKSISDYFENHGWQITGLYELEAGATSIRLTRNNGRDTGDILIEPYPGEPGRVRIMAIVFL